VNLSLSIPLHWKKKDQEEEKPLETDGEPSEKEIKEYLNQQPEEDLGL